MKTSIVRPLNCPRIRVSTIQHVLSEIGINCFVYVVIHGKVSDPSGRIDRAVDFTAGCNTFEVDCQSDADCADCKAIKLFCNRGAPRKCVPAMVQIPPM